MECLCWFLQLATHGDKRMQEKEKDALLGKQMVVMYYRQDAIDPPILLFKGGINQFLDQSEIEPYGKKLTYSRVNPHEATVEVQRRDTGRKIVLVAKELERARVSISHIFEPGFQVLTAKRID